MATQQPVQLETKKGREAQEQQAHRRDIPGERDQDHWRCTNCGSSASFQGDGRPHACHDCGGITWTEA